MPKLIVKSGASAGREFVLTDKPVTGGRMPDNDFELRDSLVSRKHSEVRKNGASFVVSDLGSSNGTFVNNRKVEKPQSLNEGDEILIGDTVLVFRDETAARPAAPRKQTDSEIAKNLYGSSEIVRPIGEMSEDLQMDVRESIARGVSWKEMSRRAQAQTAAPAEAPPAEGAKAAAEVGTVRPGGPPAVDKKFFLLYQLGKAVTQATTLDEILDVALHISLEEVGAERGVVMLQDAASNDLVARVCRHRDRGLLDPEEMTVSRTITSRVLKDKVAILTNDAKEDSRFAMGLSIIQYNIRAAMCVPLWDKQDVLGVVYVDNLLKTKAFTKDDLELLTAIANQIAIRIKQEELYARLKDQAVMRANLERLHPPEVVDKILEQEVSLGVEERQVTVLFCDIQGFTKLSEKNPPPEVSRLLNAYYENLARIVFEHHGSVNKFIGDGVMAIFGAAGDQPDHAIQAVKAGQDVLRVRPQLLSAAPSGVNYNLRVGINSGTVLVGWVGSLKLMEYTVLGDTVNIASRLEALAQPNTLCIGEKTHSLLNGAVPAKSLGKRQLRGREQEIGVFEVTAD
ncbi:MAG: FHA domain-containing protein [Planctomycetes bacterium]|nr:FHA domain-containing protein [Planctomycetota bacterium]